MKRDSDSWTEAELHAKDEEIRAASNGWERLAIIARDRRLWLGLQQDELAEYGGPAKTTVSKIERAAADVYSPRVLQQMERVLGWGRGSIRTDIIEWPDDLLEDRWDRMSHYFGFIETDEPDYLEAQAIDRSQGVASAASLTDDELVAELTYRFKRYSRDLAEARLAATQQTEDSDEAQEPQQDQGRPPSSITGRGRRGRGAPIAGVTDPSARPVEPDWSDLTGKAARRVDPALRDPNQRHSDE